jgi:leader peptidase (prepilin peptidase)/N-methyltransferase
MNISRTESAAVIDAGPSGKLDDTDRAPFLRHPAPVALISTAFAALAFTRHQLGAGAVVAAFLAVVLVVVAATDLERRIIPNRIVLPAMAIVLAANIALFPDRSLEFILAALGIGVAFLIPSLINGSLMGMGDVKLVMLLGAGLGWGAVGAIVVAVVSMFPVALGTLVRGGLAARKTAIPFGPFLSLGGLIVLIVPHIASHLIGVGGS